MVLISALEKNLIDGALVTRMKKDNPLESEAFIARTKEEIISASKSKYCPVAANISLKQILKEEGRFAVVGLPCHLHGIRKAEKINKALGKKIVFHFGLLCSHMVNFIGTMQAEFAGAQAFSSVDTFLAPFVRVDKLDYEGVKQDIQKLIFGLNVPSRWGWQTDAVFQMLVVEGNQLARKAVQVECPLGSRSSVPRQTPAEDGIRRQPLEVPNGNGVVYITAAAGVFAAVRADPAQYARQGEVFHDDLEGRFILPLLYHLDISLNVQSCRAGETAWGIIRLFYRIGPWNGLGIKLKCTGCGECSTVCPVVLSNEYDLGLSDKKATFKLYPLEWPGDKA